MAVSSGTGIYGEYEKYYIKRTGGATDRVNLPVHCEKYICYEKRKNFKRENKLRGKMTKEKDADRKVDIDYADGSPERGQKRGL